MRLELNLHEILANIDLMPFFVITSGIILFWVLMVWIVLFIVAKMR